MKIACSILLALPLLAAGGFPVRGQPLPPRLTFEVASIHPTKPGTVNGMVKPLPGGLGYTSRNIPIKLIFSLMYRVPMRQISGAPDWLGSDTYDIEAKADHAYSVDDLHVMFQNLLVDRLGLKFHKETREGPVYALAVSPSGFRMKPNSTPENFEIPMNFGADGGMIGKRVPMPYLCWFLGQQLQGDQRPVVDLTGLSGFYDFTLLFAPQLPPDVPRDSLPPGLLDRPSLFEAVKQQLGLTLTAQKGPVDYYVIDHVERPSEN